MTAADASTPIITATGVVKTFGGLRAVDVDKLEIRRNKITALIGPNGAGKTTLFNVICGIRPPTSGVVLFEGREINNVPTSKRSALGIGRTFQRLELFTTLTVFDNVRVAAELAGVADADATANEQLDLLGLTGVAKTLAGELPTGSARLLEVARALASNPRVLLLDEPASGLDDTETAQLGNLLRTLKERGLTTLMVEHDMSLVMAVCDWIHVLNLGVVIASDTPKEIQRNEDVRAAYLGVSQ